jgi:DNA-directed RNA polymerase specialized sigma24 family protein
LDRLTADERYVVLGQAQYGMSYAEMATYRFGSPLETKKVDQLLQSARRKLTEAEQAWNADS